MQPKAHVNRPFDPRRDSFKQLRAIIVSLLVILPITNHLYEKHNTIEFKEYVVDDVRPPSQIVFKKSKLKSSVRKDDLYYLTATILAEAEGEGEYGMRLVGHTVINRKKIGYMGARTIRETVLAPSQYSCWQLRRNYIERASSRRDMNWRRAEAIAKKLLRNEYDKDPTKGSIDYHADYVSPKWASAYHVAARYKSHIFYIRPNFDYSKIRG
jgi:spore germination cell wall hydrolase CwlJ-like protein